MSAPAYSLAPSAAAIVEAFYDRHAPPDSDHDALALGLIPDGDAVVSMVDAAFWASLRREEGRSPLVSLAFVPPDLTAHPLMFAHPLPLEPDSLARLAPAVEAPGIHLGVWREGGEMRVWGATRILPVLCFVLEVVEPGLVVLKYRRGAEHGKFGNMAVLRADRIRVVDERSAYQPGCSSRLRRILDRVPSAMARPSRFITSTRETMVIIH